MAGRIRKLVGEEFVTYAYILLYIALSAGQILFNKVGTICFSVSGFGKSILVDGKTKK